MCSKGRKIGATECHRTVHRPDNYGFLPNFVCHNGACACVRLCVRACVRACECVFGKKGNFVLIRLV